MSLYDDCKPREYGNSFAGSYFATGGQKVRWFQREEKGFFYRDKDGRRRFGRLMNPRPAQWIEHYREVRWYVPSQDEYARHWELEGPHV